MSGSVISGRSSTAGTPSAARTSSSVGLRYSRPFAVSTTTAVMRSPRPSLCPWAISATSSTTLPQLTQAKFAPLPIFGASGGPPALADETTFSSTCPSTTAGSIHASEPFRFESHHVVALSQSHTPGWRIVRFAPTSTRSASRPSGADNTPRVLVRQHLGLGRRNAQINSKSLVTCKCLLTVAEECFPLRRFCMDRLVIPNLRK